MVLIRLNSIFGQPSKHGQAQHLADTTRTAHLKLGSVRWVSLPAVVEYGRHLLNHRQWNRFRWTLWHLYLCRTNPALNLSSARVIRNVRITLAKTPWPSSQALSLADPAAKGNSSRLRRKLARSCPELLVAARPRGTQHDAGKLRTLLSVNFRPMAWDPSP